jgi:hypothetical protein
MSKLYVHQDPFIHIIVQVRTPQNVRYSYRNFLEDRLAGIDGNASRLSDPIV